jgi:hypothetical protein
MDFLGKNLKKIKGKGYKEYEPRRALTASTAVVVGSAMRMAALFLAVATTTRTTAASALVSVWCVQHFLNNLFLT